MKCENRSHAVAQMSLDDAIKHAEEVAESKCDECGREHKQLALWLKELKKYRKQEPCDDAVSRDAVCKMICAEFVNPQDGMQEWRNAVNDVVENILHKAEQLPSVTQKPGKWLKMPIGFKCSNCNELEDRTTKFCPNCGARMV